MSLNNMSSNSDYSSTSPCEILVSPIISDQLPYKTDGYSTDISNFTEELDSMDTSDSSDSNSEQLFKSSNDQPKIEQSSNESPSVELSYKIQQITRYVRYLDQKFSQFYHLINYEEQRTNQLVRQHDRCNQLLSTFDDFLVSFEENTDSYIYCGNWFAHLISLREQLNIFDNDGELLVQSLDDKIEHLFERFIGIKNELRSSQPLSNLIRISNDLQFICDKISVVQDQLDNINNFVTATVLEQRNINGQFVKVLRGICFDIESLIIANDIEDFDCFSGQNFLQKFRQTLSQIEFI